MERVMGEYRNGKWVPTFGDDQFGVVESAQQRAADRTRTQEFITELEAENQRLREALEAAPEPGTGVLGAMEYKGTYELIESVAYDRYAEWYDGIRLAALEGE